MPRVSNEAEEMTAPKKRAPRKRTPKATDETSGVDAPRPRTRRVVKKAMSDAGEHETERAVVTERERKAPTPLAATRASKKRQSRSLWIGIGVAVVLSGAGVAIGMSDQGQIDVVAVVNERNEKINRGELRDEAGNPLTATIPVQNTEPNGGLVPADPATIPPPPEPEPVSTTTESVATSTDEVLPEIVTSEETTDEASDDEATAETVETATETPIE